MLTWGGFFAFGRSILLVGDVSRARLLPWAAAIWWLVPWVVAMKMQWSGASWFFALVGVIVVLLARADAAQVTAG